jgi:hypothetical protein
MLSNQNIIIGVISLIVITSLIYSMNSSNNSNNSNNLNNDKKKSKIDPKLVKLIIGTLVILLGLGYGSFIYFLKEREWDFSIVNMKHWLNNTSIMEDGESSLINLQMAPIMTGMAFGIIFGFIDNAGLFFGMDALDPYVKKISKDPKISAGIGNTFSDVIGAFAGTFAGSIVKQILNNKLKAEFPKGVPDGPMWAEAIGIFIGCVLGIIIPSAIMK